MSPELERLADFKAAELDHEQLLRHLAHELRQPLSGIESIAYYFDMILASAEPEVRQQCERLRRTVQQAHWLLEDASLSMKVEHAENGPVQLAEIFTRLGAQLALHEERNIELRMDPGVPPVILPVSLATQFCNHLLALYLGVGQALDPTLITMCAEPGGLRFEISAEVMSDPDDLLRLVDSPWPGSGLRRVIEAAGGSMRAESDGEALRISCLFSTP